MKTHKQLATEAIGFPPSPLTPFELERLKRRNLAKEARAAGTLPVGTRIRFLRTLDSGPDEDGPGNHYATKGELGTVAASPYGPKADPPWEGHWVFWDGWPSAPFGAIHGTDFEVHEEKEETP
jgi:hypothetical protein